MLDPDQVRVRLLTDSQLLDPDADLRRLEGVVEVARQLAGVDAATLEVQLAPGEWRTAAGPRTHDDHQPWDAATLVTGDGLELGCLRLWSRDPARWEELRDSATITSLEVLADTVVAIIESEAGATRVFEAEEESARAEAELSRVAGQISHDLNNPLAALAMSLEIALDQADDLPPLLVSLLERATNSATRMKRMTADLLTYAQVPSRGAADVQLELETVLSGLGEVLAGEVHVPGPLPRVGMSPADLRVVLVALLENAAKFSRPEHPFEVEVTADRVDDGHWRITVADRGRGIAEEERERVFAPMVRLDKRVPGLGLGLPTVRRIVESVGGEVSLAGRDGGGTVVTLTLPDPS